MKYKSIRTSFKPIILSEGLSHAFNDHVIVTNISYHLTLMLCSFNVSSLPITLPQQIIFSCSGGVWILSPIILRNICPVQSKDISIDVRPGLPTS